jgi:hypothetical protein
MPLDFWERSDPWRRRSVTTVARKRPEIAPATERTAPGFLSYLLRQGINRWMSSGGIFAASRFAWKSRQNGGGRHFEIGQQTNERHDEAA